MNLGRPISKSFDIRRPTFYQFVAHFVSMGDEFYAFSPNSSSETELGDSDHRRWEPSFIAFKNCLMNIPVSLVEF